MKLTVSVNKKQIRPGIDHTDGVDVILKTFRVAGSQLNFAVYLKKFFSRNFCTNVPSRMHFLYPHVYEFSRVFNMWSITFLFFFLTPYGVHVPFSFCKLSGEIRPGRAAVVENNFRCLQSFRG